MKRRSVKRMKPEYMIAALFYAVALLLMWWVDAANRRATNWLLNAGLATAGAVVLLVAINRRERNKDGRR